MHPENSSRLLKEVAFDGNEQKEQRKTKSKSKDLYS